MNKYYSFGLWSQRETTDGLDSDYQQFFLSISLVRRILNHGNDNKMRLFNSFWFRLKGLEHIVASCLHNILYT